MCHASRKVNTSKPPLFQKTKLLQLKNNLVTMEPQQGKSISKLFLILFIVHDNCYELQMMKISISNTVHSVLGIGQL